MTREKALDEILERLDEIQQILDRFDVGLFCCMCLRLSACRNVVCSWM